jgi:hypothetical protein
MELAHIKKLQDMINNNFKIEQIQPTIFGSDADINIVTIILISENGKKEIIRAYGDESHQLREYIRINKLYQQQQ